MVATPDEVWASSDLVLKVKEPIAQEYARLGARPGQVLFTYLHLAASRECTDALISAGNVAIAYETVRLADNSLPLLTPMSEVAGRMAPLMGAHHLMRPGGGRGTLISGVPGVTTANVVVIGAGVSGLAAATLAVGLHANVKVLDRNLDRLRQVDITSTGGSRRSPRHSSHRGGVPGRRHRHRRRAGGRREGPKLVSNDLVARMRPASVLVDISVDQGGCFEATRPTTHSDPVFEVNGSIFYCVANMPGAVPATSTARAATRHSRTRRSSPRRAGATRSRRPGPGRGR